MLSKRGFLLFGTSAVALTAGGALAVTSLSGRTIAPEVFEIMRSEAEWRALLSPDEFAVLRQHATERAGSSPLNEEKRPGTYHCAGCTLAVYSSDAKYDSGTGWPSFFQSLPDAIGTRADNTLLTPRTEVHCRRCGGHLGHIFDDGPKPTGKRHCLNGVALRFVAAEI